MGDLIALAEKHFAHLLPFTSLGRAGDHDLRRQRRLMALLREVTGIEQVRPERRPGLGAVVMGSGRSRRSGSPFSNRGTLWRCARGRQS